jgi:hypothetical protein
VTKSRKSMIGAAALLIAAGALILQKHLAEDFRN